MALRSITVDLALILVVVTLLHTEDALARQQKAPTGEDIVAVFTDYEAPPRSIEIAWLKTAVIARVVVEQSQPAERVVGQRLSVPVTEHTVRILEVFKGTDAPVGYTLSILQDSAIRRGKSPRHVGGGPLLQQGQEYVLFLEQPRHSSSLSIAWGANGVFPVQNGRIEIPPGARRMWRGRESLLRDEFAASLPAPKR